MDTNLYPYFFIHILFSIVWILKNFTLYTLYIAVLRDFVSLEQF